MKASGTMVVGVIRDDSGKPVRGARVYIVSGTGSWRDVAAVTNEKGEYQLSGMDHGVYMLSVGHEVFLTENVEVRICGTPVRMDATLTRKRG